MKILFITRLKTILMQLFLIFRHLDVFEMLRNEDERQLGKRFEIVSITDEIMMDICSHIGIMENNYICNSIYLAMKKCVLN
jgi:hypothetical protein